MALFPGVALVTGASSGIGKEIAISFAREGCSRIAILDRNEEALAETARECLELNPGATVLRERYEAQSEDEVQRAVDAVHGRFGRIDYAVNCAGPLEPSVELPISEFDMVTSINYRGLWLASRAVLGHMVFQDPLLTHDGRPGNRGSVVNIASNLGLVSRPAAPAYCASKAAVVSLTKSDAIDYSAHNIRVNCVCPGLIATPMTKDLPPDDPALSVAPMDRMGTPTEVADAVLFLSSSKATFCQGAALSVDGGYVIN
ncbi:related to dehydrogenase [Cephalotrichum gorgonifer]|uniref:Related to dehydrogenase n=1 Tax=Cephalotrichum gorgonifer TaxID=2041049 RepID=A0AAE8SUD5_9PEZI|nr:related to dehydrogenase [Cephalotrichum gorgonifer]